MFKNIKLYLQHILEKIFPILKKPVRPHRARNITQRERSAMARFYWERAWEKFYLIRNVLIIWILALLILLVEYRISKQSPATVINLIIYTNTTFHYLGSMFWNLPTNGFISLDSILESAVTILHKIKFFEQLNINLLVHLLNSTDWLIDVTTYYNELEVIKRADIRIKNLINSKITINYISNITQIIVYCVITLIYVLIGGVIPLVERKYLSLIQRRVGPKFVGYNGRLQVLADALKLLLKELIILKNTNKIIFVTLPLLVLIINLFLCENIVWAGSIYTVNTPYLLLFLILIELITSIGITYIGLLTKNKYTLITSVRIINGTVVFEIFIISVFIYFYIIYNTTGFLNTFNNSVLSNKIVYFITITPVVLYFVLLLLKKVPFDIVEAETELIMGYTTEHSGFLSGALILVEYLHLFFWSYVIVTFFIL